MSSTDHFRPNIHVLKAFKRWIEQTHFDSRHASKWGLLYRTDPEAAMCEATFWDILAGYGVDVRPNDLGSGVTAPDYLCIKNGVKFYVEVTCIGLETASRKTGLEPYFTHDSPARHFATLNLAIANEFQKKTKQCANLDEPCLLAIGTFHFESSILTITEDHIGHLLTDEPQIGMAFDPIAGHGVGDPYLVTDFRKAPFTRISGEQLSHTRHPISGLLIGGFGATPARLLGVLHPDALRPFDYELLDRIPFCRLCQNGLSHTVSVEWLPPSTTK